MNLFPDMEPALPENNDGPMSRPKRPSNWREALLALIAARLTLIELESRDAGKQTARRISLISAAGGCALFAWALLLVGGISLISESANWPWDRVAISVAALHLLAAIALFRAAKTPTEPTFPVTRAEFKKDREWIEKFQKPSKSND